MREYKVYQGIENKRRTYLAISAVVMPDEALEIANKYYKVHRGGLNIEAGYTIGKDLYIGYSDSKRSIPVWVITRK